MISIPLADLKPALAGLGKVISSRVKLKCLRCVRVDATPEKVTLTGTDLDIRVQVTLPEACTATITSFLLPLNRLQSMARGLPPRSHLYLEEGKISGDLGGTRVIEEVESPALREFPEESEFHTEPVLLPESFSQRFMEAMQCASTDETRYVLNGVALDVSGPPDSGHYLVGTDGRHLFSANSFTLPLAQSLIIPSHKILTWRGLTGAWTLASQLQGDTHIVRIVAGNWTLTARTIDGKYPDWRQVVPHFRKHRTVVTLPEDHDFSKIVNGLPGGDLKDKPVELVIENGTVAVRDTLAGEKIPLTTATAKGPDVTIQVNRHYLTKAFDYGLNRLGIIDEISAMQLTREGRQMVIMPVRLTREPIPKEEQPAPQEPQPESKPMTETNGHQTTGANRSTTPVTPAAEKPAIEVAIEKLDAFKGTFREALIGLTELTTLLKQSVREQKASEKEIHHVRQTLRSLQSVKF